MENPAKKRQTVGLGKRFASYLYINLIILLLVVFAALLVSIRALNISSREAQTALATALELQMRNMELEHSGAALKTTAECYVRDPFFEGMARQTTPASPEQLSHMRDILREIAAGFSNSQNRFDFFYFPNADLIVGEERYSNDRAKEAEHLFLEHAEEYAPATGEYVQWLGRLEEDTYSVYLRTLAPGAYYIYVRYSRPDYELSETILKNLSGAEMYVYDKYGHSHALEKNAVLDGVYAYYDFGDANSGTLFFKHAGHYYIGAFCTMTNRQTRLAAFFRDTALETRNNMIKGLMAAVGVLLAVGVVLLFFGAKKVYRPIGQIITKLPEAQEAGENRDDLSILSRALDFRDDKLQEQEQLLLDSWFLRLLRGAGTDDFSEYQDRWLAAQQGKVFQVAAIRMDAADDTLGVLPEQKMEEQLTAFLREEGYRPRAWRERVGLILLVEQGNSDRGTDALADAFRRFSESHPEYGASAYISEACRSVRELHRCRDEAMMAYDYGLLTDQIGVVVRYADVEHIIQKKETLGVNYNSLNLLSDYISALSVKKAISQYDALVAQFFDNGKHVLTRDDIVFPIIANTIALAFYDIVIPGDISRESVLQAADKVMNAKNAVDLRAVLQESLDQFRQQSDRYSGSYDRFEQIRMYIQDNYRDPSLSSSLVADRFGVSQSSITRMFKKYNNSGFLSFVHKLRVVEATKLLKETSLSEKEIAAMVGYNNDLTMLRAFKTYAHITPSAVRTQNPAD